MILDGKKVRDEKIEIVRKQIEKKGLKLTLAIIHIGFYAPSEVYVRNKIKYCEKAGINTKLIRLDTSTTEEVCKIIDDLNKDNDITGILLQCPVPDNIDLDKCIKHIDPKKDVDGFTKENTLNLINNKKGLRPCTAKGIMSLLKYYDIKLSGKNVCILGRGNLVGKPLIFEMLNANATVTVCHSKTENLKEKTLSSDIIICGVGIPHLLTSDMVRDGAIVIDAGVSVEDGKVIGDADFENLEDKCLYITPNPGGVGPMTIASVIENVIEAHEMGDKNEW